MRENKRVFHWLRFVYGT